jgi:hypothetical protein
MIHAPSTSEAPDLIAVLIGGGAGPEAAAGSRQMGAGLPL